jgi:arabinofuranan 3-O-arabinosyltransferase
MPVRGHAKDSDATGALVTPAAPTSALLDADGVLAPVRVPRGDAGADTSQVGGRLRLAGLTVALVGLSLAATLTSQPGRYAADSRLEYVTEPQQFLARHAYLWDDARSMGKPTSHFSPVVAAFQTAVGWLGAPPWVIERLTHALFLSIAATGVLVLMRAVWPRVTIAHAAAAFVFTFSPFTSQFLTPSGLFLAYALTPWFMWITVRGLRDGDPWRWAAAFALALAAFGALNAPSLGYALLPAAVTAICIAVFEQRSAGRLWRWVWRSALLGTLVCSAALVVLWFQRPELAVNLRTTELPEAIARTSSWFESWRGLGSWLTYFGRAPEVIPYLTEPLVILASFVAPVVAVLALLVVDRRHRVWFGSILLVSLVLMVGGHPNDDPSPFGRLLMGAFDQSTTARGFRATYKAGAGLMVAVALLVGAAVVAIERRASPGSIPSGRPLARSVSGPSRRQPFIRLLMAPIGGALVLASFPFWTGRLYAERETYGDIPQYWEEAFDHLRTVEQPGRVLVLPGGSRQRHRWGYVNDSVFDGFSPLSPLINRLLPPATAESADLVAVLDEYSASSGYIEGTIGPILGRIGVQWIVVVNDLDWQQMGAPRPSAYDGLRSDPGLDLVESFGEPGVNTTAPSDPFAVLLGEDRLAPVELYRVVGARSPEPRLEAAPPLLVAGAGDAWPALSATGLLGGPPVAYTGAADDPVLRDLVASGADVVVTDGNRRRATQVANGRQWQSPTLALTEPHRRDPDDLFGRTSSQSVATYADAAWITATRYGSALTAYEIESRPANALDGIPRTAWMLKGPGDLVGQSITIELAEPVTVTRVSVEPVAEDPNQRRLAALDVTTRSSARVETVTRVSLDEPSGGRSEVTVAAAGATSIEVTIAAVDGDENLTAAGISEIAFETPDGPLDLREFVRTPEDLAVRAAVDTVLYELLAERPPRYELRRRIGIGADDEETELRREIVTFGTHEYDLHATVRADERTPGRVVRRLLRRLRRSDCAPLFAVDAAPVEVRAVATDRDPSVDNLRAGVSVELEGCRPVRLAPGRHRIESLAGVSGSVSTVSLVAETTRDESRSSATNGAPIGTVEVTSRTPTQSELTLDAPAGTLLVGGMPWHEGWVADGGHLRSFPVPLDTFAAWTVDDDDVQAATLRFAPQRWYELAMAVSAAAAVWCLWRVTRRQRRSRA